MFGISYRPGPASIAVVSIAVLFMFGFGMAFGGEAALNKSVGLDDQHESITDAKQTVRENLTANTSGFEEAAVLTGYRPIASIGFPLTHFGADVGYRYPSMVTPALRGIQVSVVGGVVLFTYIRFKQLRRYHNGG